MRKLWKIVIFALLLVVLGCSGKSAETRCAGVACERGVCDPDSGACLNAGSCLDDAQCLQGWLCSSGKCVAQIPCDDEVGCEQGVCSGGACVNAETCATQDDCIDGYRCAPSGECVEDPCGGVDCARGVCNPSTRTCVNSDVCTAASQADDCLSGFYCYGQGCASGDDICADLDCGRGVCDPEAQECIQPDTCTVDVDCLEGTYCADDQTCQLNQCDVQMRVCARGVCDPVDGRCYNATDCQAQDECVDGYSCVQGECRETGDECAGGCPGTQVCTYLPDTQEAFCDEGGTCYSALDCVDDRVCVDGACGSGPSCQPDALEPNDASATATRIASLPNNLALATICGTDVDVFGFHTDDSPLFRGTLVVDLAIDAVDVGAGTLELEVERPDGTIDTATTDATGVAHITVDVGVLDLGEYEIRVRAGAGLLPSGLRYGLFADMVDDAVVQACANSIPLGPDTIVDNTNSGASFLLSTSCTQEDSLAGENVYSFTATEPSWVRIVVAPDAGVDVAVTLRRRCEAVTSIECSNGGTAGGTEILATFVPPGDYFVIVEGVGSAGGGYELAFTSQPVVCDRTDATCVDAMTSQFCNGQGTGFEEETCTTDCDAATGHCTRLPRDVCFTAPDASAGLVDTVDWSTFTNDYDPGVGGCVPDTFGTQTAGPDVAYYIELPPDHVIHAVQTLGSADRGSMYLVEDCLNLDSCVAGVNANTGLIEELTYFNTSGMTETLWLISDVELDTFGYSLGNMTIDVEPTICTPGTQQCSNSQVSETCQPLGTVWDPVFCSFGCQTGACEPVVNNQCSGAVDLIASGPFTGRIDEYTPGYNPGYSGCTARYASGPDSVFSITPAAGEVALVSLTADFDAALWVGTDCADLANTCVVGSDVSGQNDETLEFAGDGTTTYYVVVDSQSNATGMYTISASLQQPTCSPGVALQCLDATTLQYCTPLGIEAPYTCSTTCTNASCDAPLGQICPDPIVLADGQTFAGTLDVPNTINPGVGTSGACSFPTDAEPYGSDVIFAVDLLAGEWLFADYDMNSSYGIMYALSDCADTDSCLNRSTEGMQGSVVFEALTDQRVYLVLDRTTTAVSAVTYTVNVDIRRQDCAIGSPPFCADATTLQYCDPLGFSRDYTCNGNCVGGACDTPRGDECIDPIRVQGGDVVTGDWSSGENHVQPVTPLDGWCEFDDLSTPTGFEDIYVIDLLPGDLLRASLTTNYGSAIHYILEDCWDTSTCRDANFRRASGEVQYYSQFGGPVYVVVDSISSFNTSTPYTLAFDVSTGAVCAPGEGTCSAGSLTLCDDGGSSISAPISCQGGCATPQACAPDPGADLCATAPFTFGTSVYASFADLTNDMNITSAGCTGTSGGGSDLVYAVSAGPGDVIHATVQSLGFESVQVYIASDCTDPDGTCQSGARGDSTDFAEAYFAPTTFGTYYVVAEATSSFSDEPFAFEVETVVPECVPGDYQCAPSGQSMLSCNGYGLWDTYACSGGCINDACVTPTGQACFDAIVLGDGDTGAGIFDVSNDLNPGTGVVGACDFGTIQGSGADTIYAVDLIAGDVLNVTFTSTSAYGMAYLLSDCADTSSCLANSDDGTSGALQYIATTDETIYLIMDRSTSGTTTLSYTVDVQIVRPNCIPGDPATCIDPTTLQYCDSAGFLQQYTCGGASGTCTAGACDTPEGNICADAGVLTDGTHLVGDFVGSDDSSPAEGTYGACTFGVGDAPEGVDHFYRVDLSAGDWFIADYTTSVTSSIAYLLGTCGDVDTCRAVTAEGADGRLAYQAPADETLYFVMDRTTPGPTAIAWTLDVTIGQPTCTRGTTQCAPDGTTLRWCDSYGLFEDWACSTTCTAGACDDPSSAICADAIPLTDGSMVIDDFSGTNDADLGSGAVGLCDFGTYAQPGTDHYYRVDLNAGQTLTADWTATSSYALVYFTSDCLDGAACLDNTGIGLSGSLNYTATTAETVFVVVDRNLSGSTASLGYTLNITIN